ncbi:MAG: response regulator [Pseudomonadota bacterium]|nr:response regulator [Pseudomonadota bacterium]
MAEPVALLIEDDPVAASVVTGWLTAAGWRVEIADNGADGLRRFSELRPGLVVADVLLPGLDGTAVCAHIRMSPWGGRVRIVLISARTHAQEAALAAGADAFLAKPLRRDDLLAAVSPQDLPQDAPGDAPAAGESLRPGTVRVPRVEVLGTAEGACGGDEEGELGPDVLPALLRRLHDTAFNGVLEAEGADGLRARLFFSRGAPAAARSSDEGTGFGQVLLRLGILSAEHLAASVEEGRRTGTPLGEVLLRSQLIERRAVERALREQVLLRAVGIGSIPAGRYVLDSAEPIGLAGFDVHPAAITWRLGAAPPPLADEDLPRFIRLEPALLGLWPLLDPDNTRGVLRALLLGGASAGDCVRISGAGAGALVAHLRDWGLLRLTEEAAPPQLRDAGLAELDVTALVETLRAEHQALLDANHYTVLGLQPDADGDEINAATVAALARFHPDGHPAALDATSRARARAIYERALEAGRVLSDPARRTIYDARLGGETHVPQGQIGMEDHAVLQAERARELFLRGEFVTAAALFHMAILLEGEAADILAMLGWARHVACPEDGSAGETELRRALGLDPDDEYALYYLGRLLGARGEVDAARRLLRSAVEKNHEFDLAREALRDLEP